MTTPLYIESPELDEFAAFCGELILENKTRMVLEDFQRTMLGDYFAGCTESLILLPKKNGKSSLMAALVLYHLLTTDDAAVVIAASSAKQAKIIFDQAHGFIRRTPGLSKHFEVRPGFKEIRSKVDGGLIQVLASGVDTADGVIPTLAIVDELHRHKSSDLYGVFRDGLGPRDGRIITITTAGDDERSPLGRMRAAAYKLPCLKRVGAYRYCKSANGQFVMHEWALEPTEDRDDIRIVKRANPASWQTEEKLAERHDSPTTTSWQWARFSCGVWVQGEGSAIQPHEWDALCDLVAFIPPGAPIWAGIDFGWKYDTTAITYIWWETETRRVVGTPIILEPPGDDLALDERAVRTALLVLAGKKRFDRQAFIAELSEETPRECVEKWADSIDAIPAAYDIQTVTYDPNAEGRLFAQQVEREHHIPFTEFEQSASPLSRADGLLMESIRRKEIVHDGHEILRSHVLNAVEIPVAGERFYFGRSKRGPRKPMDALRALSMAHDTAMRNGGVVSQPKPSRAYFF